MAGNSTAAASSPLTVSRFTLRVLAWLPVAFVAWYFAAPLLLAPAVLLMRGVAHAGFADLVRSIEQVGTVATFVTPLRPGGAAFASVLTVDVNLLLYSFGLPLFAALTLAARAPSCGRYLALGYVALVPCIAWGALADFLKSVAVTGGPAIASQTGFVAWQREAIVFAYQFGALILPAVAPAVLWVALHGKFIAALRRPRQPA